MAHTMVMVPEGHTVSVHPPGQMPLPPGPGNMPAGMIHDPMQQGALAAMNAALPVPNEQAASKTPQQPKRKAKPAAKKVVEKASGKQDSK